MQQAEKLEDAELARNPNDFVSNLEMSLLEFFPILIAQYRQQQLVVQLRLERAPIDVEEIGVLRGAPVL